MGLLGTLIRQLYFFPESYLNSRIFYSNRTNVISSFYMDFDFEDLRSRLVRGKKID